MQPKIVDFPLTRIAGISAPFRGALSPDSNAQQVIPPLWRQLFSTIPWTPAPSYGICQMFGPDSSDLIYTAGIEIAPRAPLPAGLVELEIPAGSHAVFTHHGPLLTLPATMHSLYNDWLPSSGLRVRRGPHFELYDHRFQPDSPTSELDLYIPIEL